MSDSSGSPAGGGLFASLAARLPRPGRRLEVNLRRDSAASECLARSRFIEMAAGFTPYVGVETPDGVFIVDTHDPKIGGVLFERRGRMEMRRLREALRVLEALDLARPRTTFLDLGANIGTTAVPAVRSHGFAKVVAFEPFPGTVRLLRANIALNDLCERVTVVEVAVSDRNGMADLDVTSENSGAHWVVPPGSEVNSPVEARRVQVETASLDSLAARGLFKPDEVALIWMDIQGHEVHALGGATALLERGVPIVMELGVKYLRRGGRLDQLEPLLAGSYTGVIDLRKAGKGGQPPMRPIAALPDLLAQGLTDVIVFRAPSTRPGPA